MIRRSHNLHCIFYCPMQFILSNENIRQLKFITSEYFDNIVQKAANECAHEYINKAGNSQSYLWLLSAMYIQKYVNLKFGESSVVEVTIALSACLSI